jgi:hypothetical protein
VDWGSRAAQYLGGSPNPQSRKTTTDIAKTQLMRVRSLKIRRECISLVNTALDPEAATEPSHSAPSSRDVSPAIVDVLIRFSTEHGEAYSAY